MKKRIIYRSGNVVHLFRFGSTSNEKIAASFADPIEEAIENGIPADAVSLANYVLWFYSDNHFGTVSFEENEA